MAPLKARLNLLREDFDWLVRQQGKIPGANTKDVAAWWPSALRLGKGWDLLVSKLTAEEAMNGHLLAKQKWSEGRMSPHTGRQLKDRGTHSCSLCNASFFGLMEYTNHLRKRHGIHPEVRGYIEGTVCGSCLRDFHTLQRVRQHLLYATKCLGHLKEVWTPMEAAMVESSICTKTAYRIPWSYRHGPKMPTKAEWAEAAPHKLFPEETQDMGLRRCLEMCRDAATAKEEELQESWLDLVV